MNFINILRKFKKRIIQLLLGVVVGRFVIQPFVTAIFWYQIKDTNPNLTYWQVLYNQYRDSQTSLSSIEIMLGYSLLGVLLVFLISKITTTSNKMLKSHEFLLQELDTNIGTLLKRGESENIEFKSSLRWDINQQKINKNLYKSIVKTVAALLNSSGGTLLIGVDDNGIPTGLERDIQSLSKKNRDGFELLLSDLLVSHLGADLSSLIKIVFHEIDTVEICRVILIPSRRPVFVKENNDTRFYIRSGASTRELNTADSISYIDSHKRFSKTRLLSRNFIAGR